METKLKRKRKRRKKRKPNMKRRRKPVPMITAATNPLKVKIPPIKEGQVIREGITVLLHTPAVLHWFF